MEKQYHGHKTMIDGTRVEMTASEAKEMWEYAEAAQAKRASAMPSSIDALSAMSDARQRMNELGWSDGIYCPKDGREFAVCEVGSTGMWTAFYGGEWPDGHVHYAGCVGRPDRMFWKAIDKLTENEAALVAESDKRAGELIEAELKSFARIDAMISGEATHD